MEIAPQKCTWVRYPNDPGAFSFLAGRCAGHCYDRPITAASACSRPV